VRRGGGHLEGGVGDDLAVLGAEQLDGSSDQASNRSAVVEDARTEGAVVLSLRLAEGEEPRYCVARLVTSADAVAADHLPRWRG
jgi:hypothetical protein